jgi:hypothetical protein
MRKAVINLIASFLLTVFFIWTSEVFVELAFCKLSRTEWMIVFLTFYTFLYHPVTKR